MSTSSYLEAPDVSSAWIQALKLVDAKPSRSAIHLVVRIADPLTEDARVRGLADRLVDERGKQPIATVRNTIYPEAMADRYAEPSELAAHYRSQYETIRRFPGNRHGTYFGRMVDLPFGDSGSVDQLSDLVEKLREAKSGRRLTSRYEMNVALAGIDIPVYSSAQDRRQLYGFPCLSFCSFHLADDKVCLAAHYRNQYLIERAYGNYLGLGQLLGYIARASEFGVGELLVVAGHATIEVGTRRLHELLRDAEPVVYDASESASSRRRR